MPLLRYDPLTPWSDEEQAWLRLRGNQQANLLDRIISQQSGHLYKNTAHHLPTPDEAAFARAFFADPYVQEAAERGWVKLPPDDDPRHWHFGSRPVASDGGRKKPSALLFFRQQWAPFIRRGLLSRGILGKINHSLLVKLNSNLKRMGVDINQLLPAHGTVKSSFNIQTGPSVETVSTLHDVLSYLLRPPKLIKNEDSSRDFRRARAIEFIRDHPDVFSGLTTREIFERFGRLQPDLHEELATYPEIEQEELFRSLGIKGLGKIIAARPEFKDALKQEKRAVARLGKG